MLYDNAVLVTIVKKVFPTTRRNIVLLVLIFVTTVNYINYNK